MNINMSHLPIAMACLASFGSHVYATDRLVPSQYDTIQSAINASVAGDTITVSDGNYLEVINFNGRAVTVQSSNGSAVTKIARPPAGPSSPTVTFSSGEASTSVLKGFTISGGTGEFTDIFGCGCDGYQLGGGIFINSSSPTIRDCNIADNNCGTYFSRGGGVYVAGGTPQFEHCDITRNTANGGYGSGGGIYVAHGAPVFIDCNIKGNSVSSYHSGNCGGLAVASGSPMLIDCRITGNSASGGVGGMCVNSSTTLQRVYLGSANGNPPYVGEFSDAGGNSLAGDCNGNGVADALDIANGYSGDLDADGMPDECRCGHYPTITCCPGDISGNGAVNGVDLAAIIATWGTDGQDDFDCDIDDDGIVGGLDLGIVLSGWGPCSN